MLFSLPRMGRHARIMFFNDYEISEPNGCKWSKLGILIFSLNFHFVMQRYARGSALIFFLCVSSIIRLKYLHNPLKFYTGLESSQHYLCNVKLKILILNKKKVQYNYFKYL